VVEVSVSDLMTGYAGQTGKQTREIFDAARGKVLFVDEAYQLNPARGGPYAQEAVDEIVKCLTHSDFKEKIVVIFAGYVEDINEMLTVNKGLQSRFQEKIEFQNFSREKTILLLKTGLEKKQLALNCDALDNLNDAMDKLVKIPTFSNGRDIDNLVSRVLMTYISDFSSDVYPDGRAMISWGCLNSALSAMISERSTERIANSNLSTVDTSKALTCSAGVMERPPPRTNIATTQQQHTHENNRHCDQSSEINDFNSSLFDVCFETVLNDESWNSADGVKYLSGLPPDDPKLYELACLVATRLKISKDEAMKKVCNWREKQLDVQRLIEEQEEEQELARKQKRKAKVPIWQCQACGRACKPFIVCHYMPRVIGYSEIDVSK
jgi:SpoVK/Ycf46/Vps4 family AAA+-type ATPase